jgi:lysyl-tRNA synthetase class 2
MAEEQLIQERLKKLEEIKKQGINPYPYSFEQKNHAADILHRYAHLKNEQSTEDHVSIAGRIMQLRRMGKASFAHIQDMSGKIQAYFRFDDIGEKQYALLKNSDIGDIIGIEGNVFKTKTGETTVYARKIEMLCKSIRPLPEKFHGLKDDDTRFRHRELDLIMNPHVKETLVKRSKILKFIREFLDSKGFVEVTTPILQTQYGGASAKPFITKVNAWNMPMFLKISPELYLKRLLVGGFEKIYDMNYNFRNEGVDKTHNPEFYMIEYYWAYADRDKMIELTEELWEYVAMKLNGTTEIEYEGKKISLKRPWKKITMKDALKEHGQIDIDKLDDEELKDIMHGYNAEYKGDFTRGKALQALFEAVVEDKLIQPTHVIDHPIESTPLCKQTKYDAKLVERTEFYVNGWEGGNGYSELNDPILQRKLLEEQAARGRAGEEETHPMDENFIEAIETGMPPAGGMGLGVERMIMLLTGSDSIREVIPFPIMKPEERNEQAEAKKVDKLEEQKSKHKNK